MALLSINYFSESLELQMNMNVIIPERTPPKGGWPVLYLLHGLSDNEGAWCRWTSIERYLGAENYDLCVVMPTTFRGFYTDAVEAGAKHFTHVTEDVPALIHKLFPITTKRSETFAAGLSMGGYGALKLGLVYPDRYAAVATLSGAVDLVGIIDDDNPLKDEFAPVFGKEMKGSINDLFAQSEALVENEKGIKEADRLSIYQCCGSEDFLIEGNRKYHDTFKDRLRLTYEEWPGVHEWGFWDVSIQKVLAWLPLKRAK